MAKNDDSMAMLNDDEVRVLPPDFTLKRIIGEDVDLNELLGPESVVKAQKVIDNHKSNFISWVMQDLAALEDSYAKARDNLPRCSAEIKKIARAAFVIKSQAGTFGFSLATQVAKSLDDFCTQRFKANEQHLQVIRKHIDVLSLIFRTNITGDGGENGQQLSQMLALLVKKFS